MLPSKILVYFIFIFHPCVSVHHELHYSQESYCCKCYQRNWSEEKKVKIQIVRNAIQKRKQNKILATPKVEHCQYNTGIFDL